MQKMETIKIEKGQHFIKCGEKQKELYIILQGRVNMLTKNDSILLEAGNIIGLAACAKRVHQYDYIALENTVMVSYAYTKTEDMANIFKTQPKYAPVFTLAAVKQANAVLQHYKRIFLLAKKFYKCGADTFGNYRFFCTKYGIAEKKFSKMQELVALDEKAIIEEWRIQYYQAFAKRPLAELEKFYLDHLDMNLGEIFRTSEIMRKAVEKMEAVWEYLNYWKSVLLSTDRDDLFQLIFDLEIQVSKTNVKRKEIAQMMEKLIQFIQESQLYSEKEMQERFKEYKEYDFTAIPEKKVEETPPLEKELPEEEVVEEEKENLQDSLEYILNYASCEPEQVAQIQEQIASYRELTDIYSTEDSVRKLRKSLAASYYSVYKAAIKRALKEPGVPQILKMFFNFGYMDAQLAGMENVNALYDLADRLVLCNSDHIFTMFEWLKAIYEGKREPSRNEFDLDYAGYLADMRKNGNITEREQKEWQEDQWRKVEFEIENMFTSSNRAVYGKISIFTPLLCGYDIVNSAESMLVTARKIDELLEEIKKVDYSIFYREVMFSDPEHDITREFLKKEVLPDIILMPNAGSNAMMWQETAGTRRDTPGRFLFPILTTANLEELMIENAGRFRWEICRKEQGARWNDVREQSLTSEYYDYIQYYRKNHELSADAKEKIKNALWKSKNNYREVFIKDYQIWMRYESRGSFRMNRVARGILFRYCPFSKDMRIALKDNPMYQEMIQKYEILEGRKKRHMELFMDRYQKAGGDMTEELLENEKYYDL